MRTPTEYASEVSLQRVNPAPSLLRRLAPRSWLLREVLAGLVFLDTDYLGPLFEQQDIS